MYFPNDMLIEYIKLEDGTIIERPKKIGDTVTMIYPKKFKIDSTETSNAEGK